MGYKNKEAEVEYHQKYRKENREKVNRWHRQWIKAHPLDKRHKELRLASQCKYRETHREQLREQSQKYREKYTEEIKIKIKNRTQKIKDEVFEHYGGYKCACCGETTKKFLSLDHINGGGNKSRRQTGGGGVNTYLWIKRNNFLPGFQVLCFNCNQGRYLNGGICPHKEIKNE